MMFVNHLAVSLTAWYAVHALIPEAGPLEPSSLGLVALGTALPDIDHPNSTIGSQFKWLSWPIRVVFGHRTITHSLIAVGALWYLATIFPWLNPLLFGYVGHLVGDWLTPAGLKLFWPFSKIHKSPFPIPTNSLAEYVIVWVGVSAVFTGVSIYA